MHISVLQEPILAFFRDKRLRLFVDGTLGAAGHSLAILGEHPELQQLIGFDRDLSALAIAREKLPASSLLINSNFAAMKEELSVRGIDQVDGILLDIGVSSMQLDQPERGFSFQKDGPLDMRMDSNQSLTAEDVVNSYPEETLARIIYEFGEEPGSRRAAKAICQARRKGRIDTTQKLVDVLSSVLFRRGKTHPATRVFQALRMEVNQELASLEKGLKAAISLLAPEGILAVISFHSLEDRLVKHYFRTLDDEAFAILTKKPIEASLEEARKNPRARSAKLRAVQRKA